MGKYDVFLIEKPGINGLTKAEVMDIFDSLNGDEAYPLEVFNPNGESSAMGFITKAGADKINHSYYGNDEFEDKGLYQFIAKILGDMDLENPLGTYSFEGLKIFMSR